MAHHSTDNPEEGRGSSAIVAFRSLRVATPDGLRPAKILTQSGRIVELAPWDSPTEQAHLHDFGNHILMPGLIDTHVHINDAGPESEHRPTRTDWEGFETATKAALSGGVTTLVDMPLNCVPETINLAALEQKRKAAQHAWTDWMTWGGIVGNSNRNGNHTELTSLIESGIPGFKCFLIDSGIPTFAWADEAQLRRSLTILQSNEVRHQNLPILAHAEIAQSIDESTEQLNANKADWTSYSTYLASRPDEAELHAIELLIRLAKEFDAPFHIVHLTTAKALPILKAARASGLKLTVETCPQYLFFSAEDIPDRATAFKCAPPIRSGANRQALWQALLDGDIDMIATDHSPCPPSLKNPETGRFDTAWGGVASLGLALPIIWTLLTEHNPSALEQNTANICTWLATQPAVLAGLTGKKGSLAPGHDADIFVFNPEAEWTVTADHLHFRHKLSPYLGQQLWGRVLQTFLRGNSVFKMESNSATFSPAPSGRELRRTS